MYYMKPNMLLFRVQLGYLSQKMEKQIPRENYNTMKRQIENVAM